MMLPKSKGGLRIVIIASVVDERGAANRAGYQVTWSIPHPGYVSQHLEITVMSHDAEME